VGAAYGALAPVVLFSAIALLGWPRTRNLDGELVAEFAPFVLVTLPGAVLLGGSLGWLLSRGIVRRRIPTMGLGLLAGWLNGAFSGGINALAGNPCRLGNEALVGSVLGGLLLVVLFSYLCVPLSLVIALLIRRSVAPMTSP
jgi:hypothetical protein